MRNLHKKKSKTIRKTTSRKTKKHSLWQRYGVIGALSIAVISQAITHVAPQGTVLGYASSISSSGLQAAQNNQRVGAGVAPLTLNTQLSSAAQAKANDMVTRNYWSHNTPDGNPPWVFITNAGYSYTKAGENLAYGFATSDAVVTGWMNSAAHRANVMDSAFKDVGFGIANGANYQGGENTVVVAMYGQPASVAGQTAPLAPVVPAPAAPTTPAPAAQPQAATPVTPTPVETKTAPKQETKATKAEERPFTSITRKDSQPASRNTSTLRSVLSGGAQWTAYLSVLATTIGGGWFVAKHSLAVKHALVDGEDYVLTHPALEVSLLTASLALLFFSTSGVIR